MSKQLYIHKLTQLRDGCLEDHMETEVEALEAAISALSADGDCISRKAAVGAIEEMQMPIMRSEFPEEQFVFTGMSEALSAIKELPSAQPEPQWIPRSSTERPKNREEVMVTIDDGYQRYTDTDEYVNGYFWYHDDKHIVAWKSFDEPWRGEEQ